MNDTSDLLVTAPAPRRSDDAFARAVAADVADAKKKRVGVFGLSFAVPATAAAAFAVVMAVTPSTTTTTATVPSTIAVVMPVGSAEVADDLALASLVDVLDVLDVIDDADDSTLLALAGGNRSAGAAFAFVELDGSSDQELADVEAALDSALRQL